VLVHNLDAYKQRQADCMSIDLHGRPTIDPRAMEGKGRIKDGIEEQVGDGNFWKNSKKLQISIYKFYIFFYDFYFFDN
jgi:hypothetical protein